jgi:hypothetical protein
MHCKKLFKASRKSLDAKNKKKSKSKYFCRKNLFAVDFDRALGEEFKKNSLWRVALI